MAKPLIILLGTTLAVACSDTNIEISQELIVRMYGEPRAPEQLRIPDTTSAVYDTPRWQEYVFITTILTPTAALEGAESFQLYDGDPILVRVAGRSQIIYRKALDAFADETSFSQVAIQFSEAVVGKGKLNDDLEFILSEPLLAKSETFLKEPGQNIEVDIHVQWKNTIQRDLAESAESEIMVEPAFEITVESK